MRLPLSLAWHSFTHFAIGSSPNHGVVLAASKRPLSVAADKANRVGLPISAPSMRNTALIGRQASVVRRVRLATAGGQGSSDYAGVLETVSGEIGILLVHGIGEQKRGQTLVNMGEPLCSALKNWIESASSTDQNSVGSHSSPLTGSK